MPVLNASALIVRQYAIDYLELPSLTVAQGTVLDRLINGVTTEFQRYTGRKFKRKAASAMGSYNPTGTPDDAVFEYPVGGRIFLPQYPVATIATLYVPYAAGGTTDSSTVSRTDYFLDKDSGMIELVYVDEFRDLSWRMQPLAVGFRSGANYQAGYGTVPFDLQDAAAEIVGIRWRGRKRGWELKSEGITGRSAARFEYDLERIYPSWVKGILDSYKRLRV